MIIGETNGSFEARIPFDAKLVCDLICAIRAQQIARCFFKIEISLDFVIAGGADLGISGTRCRRPGSTPPATDMRPNVNSSCLSNGIRALSPVQAINNLPHSVSSRLDFIGRCPFTEREPNCGTRALHRQTHGEQNM